MVCVIWDDDSRTIKIAIPSVASINEQLGKFQRFFNLKSLFSNSIKTERFTENLSILPGNFI